MTILTGYSPYKDDAGAIELACQVARSSGEAVRVVTVVPRGWETAVAGDTDRDFREWVAQEGAAATAEAYERLAAHPDVTSSASWVSGRSVPAALLDEAKRDDVTMIVVGSGENGPRGSITLTSKADRLLHSSMVPLAIAPRGYHVGSDAGIARVTVGFRDDDETWSLLGKVVETVRANDAALRVVTFAIRPRTMVPARVAAFHDPVFEQWKEQATRGQAEAAAHLASEGLDSSRVEFVIAEGRTWGGAMDTLDWNDADILVVGSSATHKMARVFLGSSATKILRNSTVPVLVVP